MDPVALQLGPFSITWYAIFIVTGLIIGSIIGAKEAEKHGIENDMFYDMLFNLFIFGFIGARAWYVIFDFQIYSNNLLDIFKIWNGGLAIHGGLVAGGIYLLYFAKKNNLFPLILTDIAAPSLLLGQSLGRWGNFVNQEAHGGQTSFEFLSNTLHLPDFIVNGMQINGIYYQPTFLYESIWNLIGFAIVMLFIRPKFRNNFGIITAFYLMWYGFIRFFIEMMRTDALTLGFIKVAQLTSLAMFFCGLIIIIYKVKQEK